MRMRLRHTGCMTAVRAPINAKPPAEMPRSSLSPTSRAQNQPVSSNGQRNRAVSRPATNCPPIPTTRVRTWPTRRSYTLATMMSRARIGMYRTIDGENHIPVKKVHHRPSFSAGRP